MSADTVLNFENEPDNAGLAAAYDLLKAGFHLEALARFERLSEQGSAVAPFYAAWIHQWGLAGPKDPDKALQLYALAAERDWVEAAHHLGRLNHVLRRYGEAFRWHQEAAQSGNASSMFWLSRMLRLGQGVRRDDRAADEYLVKAAEAGHVFAKRDCAMLMLRGRYGARRFLTGVRFFVEAVVSGLRMVLRGDRSQKLDKVE